MQNIEWIYNLKNEVHIFLEKMGDKKLPGYYKYSMSGDIYDSSVKWGLGNTVFAVKCLYSLDLVKGLNDKKKNEIAEYILSFQDKKNAIYDPLIIRKALLYNIISSLRSLKLSNMLSFSTIAETRQSVSVLKILGKIRDYNLPEIPCTKEAIERYLLKLDWENPWGGGSHFSHLMFFLSCSDYPDKTMLQDYAIKWINNMQKEEDGSWYIGKPSLQQRINGAMKVLTGLNAANKLDIKYPEKLIDMCLSASNNMQACDNFNIVYVLYCADKAANHTHRHNEICDFMVNRLNIYKYYYHPDKGGFSFYINKANTHYYGARITRGLNEPDIHGTCLFLWGITFISKVLNIDNKLRFNELTV